MTDRKRYYVYVHKLDGVIVYIGKGTRCRITNKSYRNPEHLRVWDELEKVKIAENLTEDEAYDLEQTFLDEYFDTNLLFNVSRKTDRPKVIEYTEVNKLFRYDENSPSGIVWASNKYAGKGRGRVVAAEGNHAGGLDSGTGYYRVRMNGTLFLTHRIVYCLISCQDIPVNLVVDHIDKNRTNNTISNLRLVARSINNVNKSHKTSNTGLQGIIERSDQQRFSVRYTLNRKRHQVFFSYTPTKHKDSTRHYPTRELAFQAAIEYRNQLVVDKLIVLTGK